MSRDTIVPHKIALLATGDEISQGDILNTNSQEIALRLITASMQPAMHVVTPDVIDEIEQAMRFLLSTHQALIITGGLGPTSDDLTRFALAKCLDSSLIFHEGTWNAICERLKKFGYTVPPDSNRQQALFPADVTIIPNPNGTAAGCYLVRGEQIIFMLPGPPFECLAMVDNVVIPVLQKAGFAQTSLRKKWLLFGVGEGQIAEELDALAKPFDCVTGYRLWYPYIEFKLHSTNAEDFTKLCKLVEKTLAPYMIGDGQQTASALLQKKLIADNIQLEIADHVTCGALQTTLMTPETYRHLVFSDTQTAPVRVAISGLTEYWQRDTGATQTNIEIVFTNPHEEKKIRFDLPLRGKRVIHYAVEFICQRIYEFLS